MPRFDEKGRLPPGIHLVGRSEFKAAFGYNKRRRDLIKGMREALLNLRRAGCPTAYVDGSFITQRRKPGDYDGCRDMDSVNEILVDPVLPDISYNRYRQKLKCMGEMFSVILGVRGSVPGFFQRDRECGAKGIAMTRFGDLDDQE